MATHLYKGALDLMQDRSTVLHLYSDENIGTDKEPVSLKLSGGAIGNNFTASMVFMDTPKATLLFDLQAGTVERIPHNPILRFFKRIRDFFRR